jgi:hypothetical protein
MQRIAPLPVGLGPARLGDLVAACPADPWEIDHIGRIARGGTYQEIGKQALALSILQRHKKSIQGGTRLEKSGTLLVTPESAKTKRREEPAGG